MTVRPTWSPALFAKSKVLIMVPNTKKIKKARILKSNWKKVESKFLSARERRKIRLLNVQQRTVQNISIQNALSNMMSKSCSSILTLIHFILDVLCITAMYVVSAATRCQYSNAFAVRRLFIRVVWTNKK